MYLLLILIPFINSLILSTFGRFLGKTGSIIITLMLYGLSIFLTIIIFYEVCFLHSVCYIKLWEWVVIEDLSVSFGFLFDSITVIMCLVVFFISSLVHCYSCGYMNDDPHFIRFLLFLSLFTFFMVIVITADNFVQLFFGWECVGLASYLLINFWYTRIQANKSALKAIIVNKIGDLTVVLAIIILYTLTKSFDYIFVFNYLNYLDLNNNYINTNLLFLANFMLLVGVIAKSAQLGLHTWLVDAMEGPTPVSALLHAATMVTVGVFCLIRCNSLFNKTPVILIYIIIIGALTALFGSIVGLLQNDIKRVIAYSTCSQLGYMILACGLTHYEVALYHLTNHAFFKALLFLTAGGVIHSLNGKQDIREMGSLLKLQPVLYISFFIGSFALVGLPFFSGYYSKDFILEFAFVNYNNYASFGYLLALIGAFFTAFYSMRLIYLTFISSIKNVNKTNILNLHKLSNFIYFPLLILSLLSIFSGWVFKDLFIGFGTNTFEFNITHSFNFLLLNLNIELGHIFLKDEFLPLPNLITLVAIFMSYFFCKVHQNEDDNVGIISKLLNLQFRKINFLNSNNFFQKKLFFDYIYYCIFTKSTFFLSYNIFYKIIDRGLYEIIGPYGLTNKLFNHSIQINNLHSKQPFWNWVQIMLISVLFITNFFVVIFISYYFNEDFIILIFTIIFLAYILLVKKL